MLPKENRLTKKKEFDLVFKNGKSIKQGFLIFKFLKNNLTQSRFGFIISKKVFTKANQRNKVKRRLRAVVQDGLNTIKYPIDVVVVALPGTNKEFLKIKEAVVKFFKHV